jgi:catechol 2,3-dioxygenase-like lactoylglutathione lyase family enzyme
MCIRRVVSTSAGDDMTASRAFYRDFLGFEVGMDMGWVINFVSPDNPTAQVIVIGKDKTAAVEPDMTIEVEDVDLAHTGVRQLMFVARHTNMTLERA